MAEFELVRPTVALKESHLAGLRELRDEGLPWYADRDLPAIAAGFDAYVEALRAPDRVHREHRVGETVLWGTWDGVYAGVITIRHSLTAALRVMGGHIGYDTRPSFRGRGVASSMLAGALPVARALGLERILLTCDDTNAASIRVIEKNGGVLEDKREVIAGRPWKRYYWIPL